MYRLSDFDYNLPPELIAQSPAKPRDHSRLLLLNKTTGKIGHHHFCDLLDYLRPGDVLVLNNSRVFPARLKARKKETRGALEIFLHQPLNQKTARENIWECLVRGKINPGMEIEFWAGKSISILQATAVASNNDGVWKIKFNFRGQKSWNIINKIGEVPLPPYIKRNKQVTGDMTSYQTVFADANKIGSVAAPTAGLHFTKSLLNKIKAKGVLIEYVTLHVGLGTFAPVKEDNILEHKMHKELASISSGTLKRLLLAKQSQKRIIAVGTTSCRTLESVNWQSIARSRVINGVDFWTDIFIYPGYKFKFVDALVTNFHLPKSTLLMLVSALAGKQFIDQVYQAALAERYRFFSYGDAMFIY